MCCQSLLSMVRKGHPARMCCQSLLSMATPYVSQTHAHTNNPHTSIDCVNMEGEAKKYDEEDLTPYDEECSTDEEFGAMRG